MVKPEETSRQKEGKLWVVVILILSILLSWLFSLRGGGPKMPQLPEVKGGFTLFGPAVHEFSRD